MGDMVSSELTVDVAWSGDGHFLAPNTAIVDNSLELPRTWTASAHRKDSAG
jgi:hypothetical protein